MFRLHLLLCLAILGFFPITIIGQTNTAQTNAAKDEQGQKVELTAGETSRESRRLSDLAATDRRRMFFDNANRSARLYLIGQISKNSEHLQGAEYQKNIGSIIGRNRIWIPFTLAVDRVDPPSVWPYTAMHITFTLTNNSAQTTSGFVQGNVTQNNWSELASARWFQSSAKVTNLAPGQSFTGNLDIGTWTALSPTPGLADISLEYWVLDANGTLTIVHRDPLNPAHQTDATYSMVGAGYGQEEIYPTCKPSGPDFITATPPTLTPSFVTTNASGEAVASGQSVILQWAVANGGFAPFGSHPGSVGNVTLTGPTIGSGTVAASGQETIQVGNLPAATFGQPFKIVATGNCGKSEASVTLQTKLPPPRIKYLNSDPSGAYINLNSSDKLSWQVDNCLAQCSISLIGELVPGAGPVFRATKLSTPGGISVTPSDTTYYTLTATSAGGSDSRKQTVTVYNPGLTGGSWYYFQILNNSQVTPCFTDAVYASSLAQATQIEQARNQGASIKQIDASEFASACQ